VPMLAGAFAQGGSHRFRHVPYVKRNHASMIALSVAIL
jgi:hypothetical protein